MRYIYQQDTGIILYVVTQNKDVAQKLCAFNEWQKIGPLTGLTIPSRTDVLMNQAPIPPNFDEIQWTVVQSEWTLKRLTTLVESRHKDVNFDTTDDGVITWLRLGMTPTAALEMATKKLLGPNDAVQSDELYAIVYE
jgi:hypothetical protein